MDKENKQQVYKNEKYAPGLEGQLEHDREATKKEVKKDDYTQVTRLTND